jgi:hypothetical protein
MQNFRLKVIASFVFAVAPLAQRSSAQFVLVDQTRSLAAYGNPEVDPNLGDSTTASGVYSKTEQFSQTSMFEYNTGSGIQTQTDTASAQQNSLVSTSELSGAGSSNTSISVSGTEQPDPIVNDADAVAGSSYTVDFMVSQPTPISLTASAVNDGVQGGGLGSEFAAVTLTSSAQSPGADPIFSAGSFITSPPFTTILQPGQTYTLTAAADTAANPEQVPSFTTSFQFDLTASVPEPATLPLAAAAFTAFLLARRRPARAP